MADELRGRRVALLATNGVEQVELTQPREAVERAGAHVQLLSISEGGIQAMHADLGPGDSFRVNARISDASPRDFDALLLPGGTFNTDRLRVDPGAVAFVRAFVGSGKPVGAIGHGPWTLVEADVVRGRTLTSSPSIHTDVRNAGGTVLDQEVVTDHSLVTSRGSDDLPAFCSTIVEWFAKRRASYRGGAGKGRFRQVSK